MEKESLWDMEDLTGYLKKKDSWVYTHIREIPHLKIGGSLRFEAEQIKLYLESKRKGPAATGPEEKLDARVYQIRK